MLTRKATKGTIPVIVLAGYLGAGKTTILNHVLRAAIGARIAVIVNDFGSTNIDSMLITSQTDGKLELTNGCICCSLDGGEFEEVLAMAVSAEPDVVIIESSGIAEPEDLARMVILSPNKTVGYGGLVYVVDAVNHHETISRHRRVSQHIELADLIVIAKSEKISGGELARLEAEVASKTKSPIVAVRNGQLAPELLFDIPDRDEVQLSLLQQGEHSHDHLHDEYRSATFKTGEPIDFTKFKSLMNNLPKGVYRAKGFVYFGMAGYEQKFVLQSVGGRWDMYAGEWNEGEVPGTTLVLIGTDFDESATLGALESAVGVGEEMIDIRRYTD